MTTNLSKAQRKSLLAARRAHEAAGRAIVRTVERIYKPGTVVSVKIGKARIVGTVEQAGGFFWSNPGTVRICNHKTGATRRFNGLSFDFYEVVFPNKNVPTK